MPRGGPAYEFYNRAYEFKSNKIYTNQIYVFLLPTKLTNKQKSTFINKVFAINSFKNACRNALYYKVNEDTFVMSYYFSNRKLAEDLVFWLKGHKKLALYGYDNIQVSEEKQIEEKQIDQAHFSVSINAAQYDALVAPYAFERIIIAHNIQGSEHRATEEMVNVIKHKLLALKDDFIKKPSWEKYSMFSGKYSSLELTDGARKIVSLITEAEKLTNTDLAGWTKTKSDVEKLLADSLANRSSRRSDDTQAFYQQEYTKYFSR